MGWLKSVAFKIICFPTGWNVMVILAYVRMLSEVDGIVT